jgi:hypothetical protein
VRRGILEWNRAFEAIGLVDAIEVRFQPDDADWDAEDVRYSTVRWSTDAAFTGFGSPLRSDPRTGQIFDADILINGESLRGYGGEWRLLLPEEAGAGETGEGTGIQGSGGTGTKRRSGSVLRRWPGRAPLSLPPQFKGAPCTVAEGLAESVGLGALSLELSGAVPAGVEVPVEFLEGAVKWLVMHEVGHALGLRHNFKGSAAVPVARLQDAAYTREHGLSGSVMDYLPVNIAPPGVEQGEFFASTLGPYDYWAIEYGYRPVPGASTPDEEVPELAKVAARSAEPGLAYGTDEDLYGGDADPYTNLFDLGSEPLEWARQQFELVAAYLGGKLPERVLREGERFQVLRRIVFGLLVRYYRSMEIAARYVGGYDVRRIHKGQAPESTYLTPIGAELQRGALAFLGDVAFRDERLALAPELLRSLPPETWQHWGMGPLDAGTVDFPLQQLVEWIRALIVDRLMHPVILGRVQNAEMLYAPGLERFTLPELMGRTSDAVWAELEADVPTTGGEMISRFRRGLQRRHLDNLVALALRPAPGAPADATSLARLELTELAGKIEGALSGNSLGPLTEAHLRESLRLIQRALEAELDLPVP